MKARRPKCGANRLVFLISTSLVGGCATTAHVVGCAITRSIDGVCSPQVTRAAAEVDELYLFQRGQARTLLIASVRGHIRSDGAPVRNARVGLMRGESPLVSSLTDSLGFYRLEAGLLDCSGNLRVVVGGDDPKSTVAAGVACGDQEVSYDLGDPAAGYEFLGRVAMSGRLGFQGRSLAEADVEILVGEDAVAATVTDAYGVFAFPPQPMVVSDCDALSVRITQRRLDLEAWAEIGCGVSRLDWDLSDG